MFCGDPAVVALELVPGPVGFCGARLWLEGVSLGEPDAYGTIGALAQGLARFRARAGERVQPSLFNEPAGECLSTVDRALFGASTSLSSSISSGQKYGAVLLSPNLCESLDDYLIVVVSNGDEQRILARRYVDSSVIEAGVPEGTLENAISLAEEFLGRP